MHTKSDRSKSNQSLMGTSFNSPLPYRKFGNKDWQRNTRGETVS